MRKTLAASLAALVAAAGTTAAVAATAPSGSLKATVFPTKAGTKTKPRAARVKLTVTNDDHSLTADKLTIFLPKNVLVSTTGLKFCSAKQISSDQSKCPKLSRAGSGTAKAVFNVANPLDLKFNVTSYLINKTTLGFWLVAQGGFNINVLAKGTLSKASGLYGKKITVAIPEAARQTACGATPESCIYNGLVSLTTSLSLNSGTHHLIATNGCPAQKEDPFKAIIHFQDNPKPPPARSITVTGAAPCTRA